MNRILIVILSFSLCACTTFHPAKLPSSQEETDVSSDVYLQSGDRVRIETTDGQVQEFKVVTVTADSVVGKNVTIRISDIASIDSRKFSGAKTTGLVLDAFGVAMAGFVINANEYY